MLKWKYLDNFFVLIPMDVNEDSISMVENLIQENTHSRF